MAEISKAEYHPPKKFLIKKLSALLKATGLSGFWKFKLYGGPGGGQR